MRWLLGVGVVGSVITALCCAGILTPLLVAMLVAAGLGALTRKDTAVSEPFLAEIVMFAGNFAPRGWAFCQGQILSIAQNTALFSLLGTTYGGNGQTTFGLPDFRARTPIHVGNGHTLGETGGENAHTITSQELPQHTHDWRASADNGTQVNPTGNVLARSLNEVYRTATNLVSLHPSTVMPVGGNQAHENRQPFLALNFIIALQGIFPSPT